MSQEALRLLTDRMEAHLGIVEVTSHALENDGAVLECGAHFAEAEVELGRDGTQSLQGELVGVVHGQQGSHQLMQLLFGLLLLDHYALLQPA